MVEMGRLYSKYDDAEAEDEEYDGAEEEVNCGRDECDDG
jgi:hypothetical protein